MASDNPEAVIDAEVIKETTAAEQPATEPEPKPEPERAAEPASS